MKISVVTTAYNEEPNVVPLLNSIVNALVEIDFEVIYVDDGSTDGTAEAVKKYGHPFVKLLELRKNYGQSTALRAGIDYAKGEFIAILDADLQNDPNDIPNMLEQIEERQVDVVTGQRINRQDKTINRIIPSLVANWIIRISTGLKIKDLGCSLRLFRSEFAKNLNLYGEMHRFIPVLLHLEGANVLQIPVKHHARRNGSSKYNINRSFKVMADLFLIVFLKRFMQRPMQLFGGVGLLFSGFGILLNIYLLFLKILGRDIGGKPLLILAVIFLLGGIQLITIGILSEILMRTYYESQNKKTYKIRRIFKVEPQDPETYFDYIKASLN